MDLRHWVAGTRAEHIRFTEDGFRLHDVDGYLVARSVETDFRRRHDIEERDGYWLVTKRETGKRFRWLPDNSRLTVDGAPVPQPFSGGSGGLIASEADIERVAPKPPSVGDIEAAGWYEPLRCMVERYPDHHFSFQITSPMPIAVGLCGGFVEGMTLLAEDRALFAKLLARCCGEQLSRIEAAARAGAHSVLLTSYYVGADAISPRDYAEVVFPFDRAICQAAREAGLFVLDWYLGDLMPNLDAVMKLPIDALYLEQGRRGYTIDPVEIRERVGPNFCLFGFAYEGDFVQNRPDDLSRELRRQFDGAGRNGAFVAGTPILPADAGREAVESYLCETRRLVRH